MKDTSQVPVVPLGSVATFIRGITFKPEELVAEGTDGAIACMRTKNVQANLDESDLLFVPAKLVRREEQFLRVNDMLVSTANSWELVGKTSWVPPLSYRATAGGFISILRADPTKVLARYLFHWFTSPEIQSRARHCGRKTTNISNMSFDQCLAIELPLPPLPEQRRIADILDKADAIRRKRELVFESSKGLSKSAFYETFGKQFMNNEEAVTLESLVEPERGISYGVVQRGQHNPEGVPVARISNIVENRFNGNEFVRVDKEISGQFRRTVLRGGEILVSIRGTVGRAAIAPADSVGWNVTREIAVIPLLPHVSCRYVHQVILTDEAQQFMTGNVKGVAQRGINLQDLRLLRVPSPKSKFVAKFIDRLDTIERLGSRFEDGLTEANDLFYTLVQRAFRGDL